MIQATALMILAAIHPAPAAIQGNYLEARTADIYTGPCFSNSEVYLTGDQAVMAWQVTAGSWRGVDLSGLGIAAAIQGSNTFSEDTPEQAKSVLIVDKDATPEQRTALIDFAKSMASGRLAQVVAIKESVFCMTLESHQGEEASASHAGAHGSMPKAPAALFWAPGIAEINSRPLGDGDHYCGNEDVAYAPLSKDVSVKPAYTVAHSFRGKDLGTTWDDARCRGTFAGTFSTPSAR